MNIDEIYELIPQDRFITREELVDTTGMDDRNIRRAIAKIRKEHNIISLSSKKGYRRVKPAEDLSEDELKEELDIVKHQLAENNSRIKKIKYNMKSQIAYLKVLEKYLEKTIDCHDNK